ncbi:hypothetical protein [Curtobacterium flaccumfaciens]|uniref:hypothetical protein n=1 Tax=Curtobacterium flaccumfaciens TaxID=2035 RepID=UPI001BDEDCD7|nr:hypothetical protein [Curtobacterium flaccumfaciens]MBT1631554.1 hypothetical protein [Curtobacterium flaccumfaciens pv. oortii]MCS5524737.1 hypothetical protein [Curtobacterium flaccumfaciens pv. oortii]MCX2846863.1 hypothetical protein [Curtobacterium flaccumfaciens pv. oortii]
MITITVVAALSVAIAGPAGSALAVAGTPAAKVTTSMEAGTLLSDIQAGRITEHDVLSVASTGFDLNGRHIDNWIGLSHSQAAHAQEGAAQIAADPEMSRAQEASPAERTLAADGKPGAATVTPSLTGTAPPLTEDKHWWNKIFQDHWYYINGKWMAWITSVPIAYGLAGACVFYDLSKASCALLGVVVGGGSALLLHEWACVSRGLWVDLPYIWKSHCNRDPS